MYNKEKKEGFMENNNNEKKIEINNDKQIEKKEIIDKKVIKEFNNVRENWDFNKDKQLLVNQFGSFNQ